MYTQGLDQHYIKDFRDFHLHFKLLQTLELDCFKYAVAHEKYFFSVKVDFEGNLYSRYVLTVFFEGKAFRVEVVGHFEKYKNESKSQIGAERRHSSVSKNQLSTY